MRRWKVVLALFILTLFVLGGISPGEAWHRRHHHNYPYYPFYPQPFVPFAPFGGPVFIEPPYPVYPTYAPPFAVDPPIQAPQPQYWYYCKTSNPPGYFPYIRECPGGWTQEVPRPSP